MPRNIKSGLIQMSLPMTEGEGTIAEIMDAMVQKHIPLIEDAGKQGVPVSYIHLTLPTILLLLHWCLCVR